MVSQRRVTLTVPVHKLLGATTIIYGKDNDNSFSVRQLLEIVRWLVVFGIEGELERPIASIAGC